MPVVPRGAGSGLAGASNAVDGAITMVMTRMDAVLKVSQADRLAVVQPGVVNKSLRDAIAGSGLFYPPDPRAKPADLAAVTGLAPRRADVPAVPQG